MVLPEGCAASIVREYGQGDARRKAAIEKSVAQFQNAKLALQRELHDVDMKLVCVKDTKMAMVRGTGLWTCGECNRGLGFNIRQAFAHHCLEHARQLPDVERVFEQNRYFNPDTFQPVHKDHFNNLARSCSKLGLDFPHPTLIPDRCISRGLQCEDCGSAFRLRERFDRHARRQHSGAEEGAPGSRGRRVASLNTEGRGASCLIVSIGPPLPPGGGHRPLARGNARSHAQEKARAAALAEQELAERRLAVAAGGAFGGRGDEELDEALVDDKAREVYERLRVDGAEQACKRLAPADRAAVVDIAKAEGDDFDRARSLARAWLDATKQEIALHSNTTPMNAMAYSGHRRSSGGQNQLTAALARLLVYFARVSTAPPASQLAPSLFAAAQCTSPPRRALFSEEGAVSLLAAAQRLRECIACEREGDSARQLVEGLAAVNALLVPVFTARAEAGSGLLGRLPGVAFVSLCLLGRGADVVPLTRCEALLGCLRTISKTTLLAAIARGDAACEQDESKRPEWQRFHDGAILAWKSSTGGYTWSSWLGESKALVSDSVATRAAALGNIGAGIQQVTASPRSYILPGGGQFNVDSFRVAFLGACSSLREQVAGLTLQVNVTDTFRVAFEKVIDRVKNTRAGYSVLDEPVLRAGARTERECFDEHFGAGDWSPGAYLVGVRAVLEQLLWLVHTCNTPVRCTTHAATLFRSTAETRRSLFLVRGFLVIWPIRCKGGGQPKPRFLPDCVGQLLAIYIMYLRPMALLVATAERKRQVLRKEQQQQQQDQQRLVRREQGGYNTDEDESTGGEEEEDGGHSDELNGDDDDDYDDDDEDDEEEEDDEDELAEARDKLGKTTTSAGDSMTKVWFDEATDRAWPTSRIREAIFAGFAEHVDVDLGTSLFRQLIAMILRNEFFRSAIDEIVEGLCNPLEAELLGEAFNHSWRTHMSCYGGGIDEAVGSPGTFGDKNSAQLFDQGLITALLFFAVLADKDKVSSYFPSFIIVFPLPLPALLTLLAW